MAAMTAMETQPAFREGYQARMRGSKPTAVPYHESTGNFSWWLRGYRAAIEEIDRQMDELEMQAAGAAPDVNL